MNIKTTNDLAGTRVLFVNWRDITNPDAGGAETHLHEVAKRLVSNGIESHIVCHRYQNAKIDEIIDGIHIHRFGHGLLFNFVVWLNIRKWEKRYRPHLIVDDSNKVPFFLPWLSRLPVIVRIHHLFDTIFFKETNFFFASYLFLLERLGYYAWRKAPVITVSASTQKELLSHGVRNITIARNGVDRVKFRPMQKERTKPYMLLSIGRIKRYKKFDTLLHAIHKLSPEFPELQLIIAGSGDDIQRLKRLADELKITDVVKFAGFVSGTAKSKLFAEASLFLITSLKEGYGLTVIEANASGTCCIGTDVPGLRDSIQDKKTGLLVPLGDVDAFCVAIRTLLTRDELRKKMEKHSMKWAEQHVWEQTAKITQDVIMRALSEYVPQ